MIWDPDPGWKTLIIFLRAEKPFFWVKKLKFFDVHPGPRIRDGKIQIWDQRSRMEKFGSTIQDPGWKKLGCGIQDPGLNIPDQQNRKFRRQIC
jgi:hypothetical protein